VNTLPIESVDWLVVHSSATPADSDIGRAEIRRKHMRQGAHDIGYHYVVRRDGTVEKGLPDNEPGFHADGYNLNSLAICMVGGRKGKTNRTENNFTEAKLISLRKILRILREDKFGAEIIGPPRFNRSATYVSRIRRKGLAQPIRINPEI